MDTVKKMTTVQVELNVANVMSVYSGKRGKCMCGCAGKHTYAKAHQQAASKDRGYDVTDDEVSDRQVRRVFNLLAEAQDSKLDMAHTKGTHMLHGDIGERSYVVYFI